MGNRRAAKMGFFLGGGERKYRANRKLPRPTLRRQNYIKINF
jgi:hypothetical protein